MDNYVVLSIETHLFFARIMKEHALFLEAGFPCKEEKWIQKADWFREQFEDLCRFINEMEFNRLGVFTYSQEEGTAAARMDGQIDEETKLSRRDELMELQQEISFDLNEQLKGIQTDVLIEGYVPNENVYIGRGYGDAPDVDGFVFVSSDENLETGDFVHVKITGSSEYDLIGEMIPEEQ